MKKGLREVIRDIELFGFEITDQRKTGHNHTQFKLRKPGPTGMLTGILTVSSTPSDWRTMENVKKNLRAIAAGRVDNRNKS